MAGGSNGDRVAAVTVVSQQGDQLAGEVLGALAAPWASARYAEPDHAERGLWLNESSRDHDLRPVRP